MEKILKKFESEPKWSYKLNKLGLKSENKGCECFEKGKRYVFDYCLYYERMKKLEGKINKSYFEIDGREVEWKMFDKREAIIQGKIVSCKWCREVNPNV